MWSEFLKPSQLSCIIMNEPADHASPHSEGEDMESGGTGGMRGGSGSASVGNLIRLEGRSPPSHDATTRLLNGPRKGMVWTVHKHVPRFLLDQTSVPVQWTRRAQPGCTSAASLQCCCDGGMTATVTIAADRRGCLGSQRGEEWTLRLWTWN